MPPVLIQFGWSQTLLLALAVAVLPVLAATLTIAAARHRRRTAHCGVSMITEGLAPAEATRSDEGRRRLKAARRRAGKAQSMKLIPRTTVGAAAGSTLALALLVCGCVFAALAGPALSQHTRTLALHQTLADLTATTKTVQVTANWTDFTGTPVQNGVGTSQNMTRGELGATTREIGRGFAALGLPLAAGQWADLSTHLFVVSGAGPRAQLARHRSLSALPRPAHEQRPGHGGRIRGRRGPGRDGGGGRYHADGRTVRVAPGRPPVGGHFGRPGQALRHRGRAGTRPWLDLLGARPDRGHPALQQLTAATIPFWVGASSRP